jgi:hypothetical protein
LKTEPEIIRFFWSKKNRYWKNSARKIVKLVEQFSGPSFGHALGDQGEILADTAFFNHDFRIRARNVRSWNQKEWKQTGHNLDRVYERDGITYGVEIKNTLKYISAEELKIKILICNFLGLRPIVVARALPAHYIYQLDAARGFALIVGKQHYPFGHDTLAQQVREQRGYKVECSRAIEEGRLRAFIQWHENNVKQIPRAIPPTHHRKQSGGRDPMIDAAKTKLMEFFKSRPNEVFYDQQLQILMEEKPFRFFHWITSAALKELREEGEIQSEILPLRI